MIQETDFLLKQGEKIIKCSVPDGNELSRSNYAKGIKEAKNADYLLTHPAWKISAKEGEVTLIPQPKAGKPVNGVMLTGPDQHNLNPNFDKEITLQDGDTYVAHTGDCRFERID